MMRLRGGIVEEGFSMGQAFSNAAAVAAFAVLRIQQLFQFGFHGLYCLTLLRVEAFADCRSEGGWIERLG